jgi:hypothetical protein
MTLIRDAYRFPCPLCKVSIVLPRQSRLGTYEGQYCQPTGEWPIQLLCIQRGRAYECTGEGLRRSLEPVPDQSPQAAVLWWIDCECDQRGCRRHSSIYTWWPGNAALSDIVNAAIEAAPTIACTADHKLALKPDKMQSWVLPYEPVSVA